MESSRPPNPPSPPAALTNEIYQYRDLVLAYNSSNGVYTASPVQKAFRLYLNMSYSQSIQQGGGNNTKFISSVRDALTLFFQVSVNN